MFELHSHDTAFTDETSIPIRRTIEARLYVSIYLTGGSLITLWDLINVCFFLRLVLCQTQCASEVIVVLSAKGVFAGHSGPP